MASKKITLQARLKGGKKTKQGLKGIDSGLKSMGKSALTAGAAYFGARGIISGLSETIQLASKADSVSRAFANLGKQIGFNEKSFQKLRNATDGTVDSIELMTQANNAMLLGIADSDDEMAELFDTAQRLAKAVGQDAKFGIESLVTGMGRQSKLMLDNLGIMIDTNKAYFDFAESLGKTTEQLTDQERKTAFLNAALSSAKEKVAALGDEELTTADKIAEMSNKVTDLKIALGEELAPVISRTIDFWMEFIGLGEKGDKTFGKFADKIAANMQREIDRTTTTIGNMIISMNDWEAVMMRAMSSGRDFTEQQAFELEKINELKEKRTELKDALELHNFAQENANELSRESADLAIRYAEGVLPLIASGLDEVQAKTFDMGSGLNNYWNQSSSVMKEALGGMSTSFQTLANAGGQANTELFELGKAASIAQATMNTYEAITKALSQGGPFLGPIMAGIIGASGFAQVAAISQTTLKKAATGFDGVVTKPTMFMTGEGNKAERVSVTPLQGPNIDGPQGGITLNISAPLVDETVIDSIIPAIQKAQRLNLA